jgi:reverse gyrase
VDEFLNKVIEPMLAELAARFDPDSVSIATPFGVGHSGLLQVVAAWREQAWRNAELLVSAPTPELRAAVAQQIELTAAAEATTIVASTSYLPPLTTTMRRDAFCASNNAKPPPEPYAFGMPSAY